MNVVLAAALGKAFEEQQHQEEGTQQQERENHQSIEDAASAGEEDELGEVGGGDTGEQGYSMLC